MLRISALLCLVVLAASEFVELQDFHTAYEIVRPGSGAAVKKGDTVSGEETKPSPRLVCSR